MAEGRTEGRTAKSEKLCLNVPEVAKELGISKPMAYMLASRSDFPSFRLGKRILVSRNALEAWLKNVSTLEPCTQLGNSQKRGRLPE